ncbi:MAG: phosphate signaling complex protein PhoU [Bacteroidetes bacterium]|nr:phosphate signaling complex protein PhoU [Bacteroidota bacterium]
MSHFEERLEHDLAEIRTTVVEIADAVEHGVRSAIQALNSMDRDLAYATVLADHPINRKADEIDRLCHRFIAKHLPSAGHLRFISSVLRMNIGLERIGDYAVTICREVVVLEHPIEEPLLGKINTLGTSALVMFRDAVTAFDQRDESLARKTMKLAAGVDSNFAEAFDTLCLEGQQGQSRVRDLFSKLSVINMLERVSDQAKNLCEDVVFILTGETKKRKPAKILFVDRSNTLFGPMACAIGRKAFPENGSFETAGLSPGEHRDSEFVTFMTDRGHNMDRYAPNAVSTDVDELDRYHAIVSLEGSVEDYLPRRPFHAVALTWSLPERPTADMSPAEKSERYIEIHRELSARIEELMQTLRGGRAS